ncbi:MAG: NAD(P)-binding domain-containing protein [Gammaproteobacteria bacterium]|nr:NAD(P)-binding domain-containing protein [Gammaproteobacteria bacterium]
MRTTTLIIGAGHAGLAMSHCLTQRGIDHVLLERGEIANSWRVERWDSLRLLTPSWQTRLPGCVDTSGDPDGFRSMPETIGMIERYAERISAPVHTQVSVESLLKSDHGYHAITTRGVWHARAVVVATGACNRVKVPRFAAGLPDGVRSLTSMQYRNPTQLEPGGVLVVGASASGAQIADELQRSGREVTLAVGEHVRVPRQYRGRDIQWWLDAAGILDEREEQVDDLERARNVASLQLMGSPDRRDVDLNALAAIGVRAVGRLVGLQDGVAQFSGALRNHVTLADLKLKRLLKNFDDWSSRVGLDAVLEAAHTPEPTRLETAPPLSMDLRKSGIRSVVWATGYTPVYDWLQVPVLDRHGRLRHRGGVVQTPGLYAMGLPFMRRRKSTLIDGAGADALELSAHLAGFLDGANQSSVVAAA